MNQKVEDAREKRAENLVREVENINNDTRMFKAAKALHMKHQKIQFVHDDQERCVSQPQEVQTAFQEALKQRKHQPYQDVHHWSKQTQ